MKKIFISLCALAAAGFSLMACTPDTVSGLDVNGTPGVDALEVNVAVDQTTNMVTFSLKNNDPTTIPVWIFSESDFVSNTTFERRYRTAGTYSVEVKAYNRNGVSDASVTKEFTVDNDYVVAVHPLFGTGSKRWKIASGVEGHLALGPSIEDVSWWAAPPNDKVATGMYDDRVTFSSDGSYIYDPGPDGLTFVNNSFAGGGEDFDMENTLQNATYVYDETANTITLPPGTYLPYMANQVQLDSQWPYTVKELDDNRLVLGWYIESQEMGWQIILEPETKVEKSPLFGNDTKVWKIASMLQGHLGLGENIENSGGWWTAAPNEKKDTGFYDDRVTFGEDGSYIYDPGPDGLIFVNSAVSSLNTSGATEDFDAAASRQEATYEYDEDAMTLKLPANTYLPYIAHQVQLDAAWTYTVKEIESNKLLLAWYIPDQEMAWQIILVPEDFDDGGGGDEPPAFDTGAEIADRSEWADALVGSWTWESSSQGHFGCGDNIGWPLNWWNANANDKPDGLFYNDVMTFGADGSYRFDPTDGLTYKNKDVTNYFGTVVDSPYGDDFVVEAMVMNSTYTYTEEGEFPNFTLPAGILFSYIASNDQLTINTTYFITGMWENQVEITWWSPGISWRYRLKRVVEAE